MIHGLSGGIRCRMFRRHNRLRVNGMAKSRQKPTFEFDHRSLALVRDIKEQRHFDMSDSPACSLPVDDDGLLATDVWLRNEFGGDDDTDFTVESASDGLEVWHNWNVYVRMPKRETMTRGNVRRVVEFLRSFPVQ